MDQNPKQDVANEPVDQDHGIVDTGVLHEDKPKPAKAAHPRRVEEEDVD